MAKEPEISSRSSPHFHIFNTPLSLTELLIILQVEDVFADGLSPIVKGDDMTMPTSTG